MNLSFFAQYASEAVRASRYRNLLKRIPRHKTLRQNSKDIFVVKIRFFATKNSPPGKCFKRRGIILYLEYRLPVSLRPNWFSPPTLPQASVSPPSPPRTKEGGNTRLRGRGRGEPTRTAEEKAWHSVYKAWKPAPLPVNPPFLLPVESIYEETCR